MTRKMLGIAAGTWLAITTVSAAAVPAGMTVGGVAFPATYPVDGRTLVLNGAGVRVFFHIVDGYATALYLPSPVHTAQGVIDAPNPKVIFTHFLHDASLARIEAEYQRIHARYCAAYACTPQADAGYRTFVAHLGPVTAGETQVLLITDQGVDVTRNGQKIVTIPDPAFGTDLVRSLVGVAAPTEGYRHALIGDGG